MFSVSKSLLVVLCLSHATSSTLLTSYANARFDPADSHFMLANFSSINSSRACLCRCLMNSMCITISYHGVTQNCQLYSAQLSQGKLQVLTSDMKAAVISLRNISISATVIFSQSNATVYGIWNTTTGGNSSPSSVGYSMGNYYPGELPQAVIDGNINSSFTSYGVCSYNITAPVCGVNTGFYVTFSNGPFLLRAFRMSTGDQYTLRDPFMITMEGSNAASSHLTLGSSWTLIYNGSTGLEMDPGRQMFGEIQTVNSSIWYSSFRLLVLAKRGVDSSVEYSEMEFLT